VADDDFLGALLKDVPLSEQKEIAGQFLASGYSADDLNLAFPGLLKQLRETTNGIKTIAQMIPTLTEKGVSDRLDTNEKIILDAVEAIKAEFKLKQKPAVASFSPITKPAAMLVASGAIGSLILVIPLFWFFLIPQELSKQRNSDLIHLTTAKGKASLKSFEQCRKASKPICKFR
jgi:hypothetical protein